MKRNSYSRHKRKVVIQAMIIGLFSLGVLSIAILFYQKSQSEMINLSSIDLCPEDKECESYDLILLDMTSPLNLVQKTFVERELKRIKNQIPLHGRLSIYLVRERLAEKLDPFFSLCNPGKGEKLSSLTNNPKLVLKQWEEGFNSKIDYILKEILDVDGSPYSPIMETVQAISLTGFPPETSKPIRIHIFSDLLQHTTQYTHYTDSPPLFSNFQASDTYLQLRTNLNQAKIFIFYTNRPKSKSIQGKKHIDFWDEYFQVNNAIIEQVRRIEG